MKNENVLSKFKELDLNGKSYKQIVKALSKVYNLADVEIRKIILNLELEGSIFIDKEKIVLTEGKDFLVGVISANSKGFAFCVSSDIDKQDVFIAHSNLNGALHSDKVLVKVRKNKRDGREEGVVLKVLARGIKSVVGTIEVFAKFAFVTPDNKKIFKDVFIPKNQLNGAKTGDKVFVMINNYDGKNMRGDVVEVLGQDNGSIETDVLSIIRSYELIEEFSPELLQMVKKIPQTIKPENYPSRKDLRDLILFTIDGDDSKDLDDAVSLEMEGDNYVLGVHIADVGEYVKRGSKLDEEAFNRATSVYFPNCVLPMLPKELSNGICSLNGNVDRLALSCFMTINKSGEVIAHQIYESVIRSTERMTYKNVTKILEGDKDLNERYAKIVPSLKRMEKLNYILEKKRIERGSINFDIPEAKIVLNPETLEVDILEQKPRTVSERLIESFMLIANETVAEHFKKLNIPFVYRIHEIPATDKIDSFNEFIAPLGLCLQPAKNKISPKDIQSFMNKIEDEKIKDVVNKIMLRCMQKAKYSPNCLGHFGLAAPFYCHFTSPIRRYPDLTIHRIIKDQINGKLNPAKIKELSQFVILSSNQSSEREVSAEHSERDVDDYFKARYMSKHIGESFKGIISGITNFGIFVELENTVEGLISVVNLPGNNYVYNEKSLVLTNTINTFKFGDEVEVIVESVDIKERNVNFKLKESKILEKN